MLLEKVMALSAVKPANRSSQPASSRPVSSARKTVSGFPAGSNLALAKRSSGMIRPPLSMASPIREPRAVRLLACPRSVG